MRKNHIPRWGRIVALLLVVSMSFPVTVSAVEPRASDYLDSYQTYVYPAGNGEIQVWFNVTADNYMDEIGALTIELYESKDNTTWTRVKTYLYTDYPSILAYNKVYHSGHVTYQGIVGRYYKAYVCIWAGENGAGDTRYVWTSAKKAT